MPGGVPQEQLPDVIDQPAPPVQLGANVSDANPIAQASGGVADLLYREEIQADQTAVMKATNALADLDQEKLYHPERGLLHQDLGDAAPKAADKVLTDYGTERSKIRTALTSDRQRDAFDQASMEHMRTVRRQVWSYELGQQKQAEAQTYAGAMENAHTAAVNTYGLPHDPGQGDPLTHQVDKQEALTRDYGKAQGWPEALITAKVAEAKSRTYTSVIDDMLAKENTAGAQKLFDDHGMEIAPDQRATVEKALRSSSRANQAQAIADSFVAIKDGQPETTESDFFIKLREDPALAKNAELYDAVARRGMDYFRMRDSAKKAAQQQIQDKIMGAVAEDPTIDPKTIVGPLSWQALDGSTREALENRHRASLIKDAVVRTDMHSWGTLDTLFSDPRRKDEALAVNMVDYVDKLDQTDFKTFKGRQDKIREGSDEMLTKDAMVNEVAQNVMRANLFSPIKATTQSRANEAVYTRTLKEQIRSQEAATGKPMNQAQVQELADRLALPMVTKASQHWWTTDDTQPTFQVIAGNKFAPEPKPENVAQWTTSLHNPHGDAFDGNVSTLKRWSQGKDDLGFDDPNRVNHARAIANGWISAANRQKIVAAYQEKHAGARPTEADIIGTYANYLKRTTPAAPVTAPEPSALSAGLDVFRAAQDAGGLAGF